MDEKLLISFGLSQKQARAYRALIVRKSLRPHQLAKLTGENRTNCYAILDRLVQLGLATKSDENKKYTYFPTSPVALRSLLTSKLNETELQLQNLDRKLPQMLSAYHLGGEQPRVEHFRGKKELRQMYTIQMEQPGRELFFIRSRADVPFFGLPMMKQVRNLAPGFKKRRLGITPIVYYAKPSRRKDARSGGLKRAWLNSQEYTAPVEWAVSGDQVQAILMEGEGYGVSINHPAIAESFRQILELLFKYIRESPAYPATLQAAEKVMADD